MALYRIKRTFPGSQDGRTTETFEAGTERELSDYLAAAADPSWIERCDLAGGPLIKNKAVTSSGRGGKTQ